MMLAKRTINLIKRYVSLFEQEGGVEDLGEVPRVVLEEEPSEGEIVRAIEDEVIVPSLERFAEVLKERLGEGYGVKLLGEGEGGSEIGLEVNKDGDVVVMKFQIVDSEPQVVFVRGDGRITVSLVPLIGGDVYDEKEIIDKLVEVEGAIDEIVNSLRQVYGEVGVEEVPVEGEGEEGVGEEVGESRLFSLRRRLIESREERIKRLKRLMELRKGRRVREQRKDDEYDLSKYEVKKVADSEVKYSQVDLPMEKESDLAMRTLQRLALLDITRKVMPDEKNIYPDIIGYVQEPRER
ncbi:MAG: hypothetical protein QXI56_08600 [Candidatus Bathyarchaeia archaeon]